MWEFIKAGGILMGPLILCSVVAFAIVCERFWSLQRKRIVPGNLVAQVWQWAKAGQLDANKISNLRAQSALGRVLASGLVNVNKSREIMKDSIEETGRHVAHDLERFLNTLGTIAAISPLLGLLGTVQGMIQIFSVITESGVGNPAVLSDGIAKALITTAVGLVVAIPALFFHRYFERRVDDLVMSMEQEALKLVEVIQGEREREQY